MLHWISINRPKKSPVQPHFRIFFIIIFRENKAMSWILCIDFFKAIRFVGVARSGKLHPACLELSCMHLVGLEGMASLEIVWNERLIDFKWNKSLQPIHIISRHKLIMVSSSHIAQFFNDQDLWKELVKMFHGDSHQ